MKCNPLPGFWVFIFALIISPRAEDSVVLQLQSTNAATILELRSTLKLPVAGSYSQYEIEWSDNLSNWQRFGDFIDGKVGVSEEKIRQVIPQTNPNAFFRVTARPAVVAGEAKVADSIYGYAAEFNGHLLSLGQLPLENFVQLYQPTNEYRAAISFDPTTATYWPAFNLDPAIHNSTNSDDPRLTDFRLNEQEFAMFKTNGYVVSQRLGSLSFADALYKVFNDDLPVLITADALLHAWHSSYLAILTETEESFLAPHLQQLLTNMLSQVDALQAQAAGTPLEPGVLDADYFLAVANSLIDGNTNYGRLGQNNAIEQTLAAANALEAITIPIFGAHRKIDFSQFKPRGQYEKTVALQRYFRAMMWCGIVDFQFQSRYDTNGFRQFAGAAALDLLLHNANERAHWDQYDTIIRGFVGAPDCMNFAHLHDLLTAANFSAPFSDLAQIYDRLWTGDLGVQNIRSGYFYSPLSAARIKLPRSFAMMPQRFTPDSWALAKVVFDDVFWDEDGIPTLEDKVMRRVPSALDVAFSVFGNDNIVPEIAARIANPNGRIYRDGLPYQHNLAAVRETIDAHDPTSWTNNLYSSWVNSLGALSSLTTGPEFPEAMRTRAFAHNTLNTQLASWTQLRHDTILYAKQSYTGGILCGYPDAWVEPRVQFWDALNQMATRARDLMTLLPSSDNYVPAAGGFTFRESDLRTNRVAFFERFMDATAKLKTISEKELAHVELTQDEIAFLQDTVEIIRSYNYGMRTYSGWYPKLFYRKLGGWEPELSEGSGRWDALVTDVHTDVPAFLPPLVNDPGSILHQAVGNVHMAFIAINCNDGHPPRMFAGPVLSHYEFEKPIDQRMTDSEWKTALKAGNLPEPPPWTKSFLVPGQFTVPSNAN